MCFKRVMIVATKIHAKDVLHPGVHENENENREKCIDPLVLIQTFKPFFLKPGRSPSLKIWSLRVLVFGKSATHSYFLCVCGLGGLAKRTKDINVDN